MDIHDINLEFNISLKKLRRMEKAGVLRIGKSKLPPHWQAVRKDIRKGKLSARSIALACRYPNMVGSIMDLTRRQRSLISEQIAAAELPPIISPPEESIPSTLAIVCGAATEGGWLLMRFIQMLQALIPDKEVGHHYVAVRILLMCKNEYGIDGAYEYLLRALMNAKDRPEMAVWWHREKTGEGSKHRTIYHRPKIAFDL